MRRFLTTRGGAAGRGRVLRVPLRAVRRAAAGRRRRTGNSASATRRTRPRSSRHWPRRSCRQCDEPGPARGGRLSRSNPAVAVDVLPRDEAAPFRVGAAQARGPDDRARLRGQARRARPAPERPRSAAWTPTGSGPSSPRSAARTRGRRSGPDRAPSGPSGLAAGPPRSGDLEQAGGAHAAADAHGDDDVASRRGACPRSARGRPCARPTCRRGGRSRSRRRRRSACSFGMPSRSRQ